MNKESVAHPNMEDPNFLWNFITAMNQVAVIDDPNFLHDYIKAVDKELRKRFTEEMVEEIEKDALENVPED